MRTIHLFAGAGGGLLADLILGHEPVCAVEWDAYCCAVLRERAADGWFPGLHVHEGDVRLFDPSAWAGRVDCLAAGFPCQDISVAGKGAGLAGERSGLWSEVGRCLAVVQPRFAFLENSPAIVGRGLDRVLADLATLGYDARWCVLGGADVGAPHLRDRWWCFAWRHSDSGLHRCSERSESDGRSQQSGQPTSQRHDADPLHPVVPDALRERGRDESLTVAGCGGAPDPLAHGAACLVADTDEVAVEAGREIRERLADAAVGGWWGAEPDVGRVAHGMAARAHRLRALGNGQVPLCAAAAWRLLGGPVCPEIAQGRDRRTGEG